MIQASELHFKYPKTDFQLEVENLSIESGEKIAILGPSGSGKTTLLNLMAGILVPESGTISVDGIDVSSLGDAARRDFRIANVGFVFQQFELVEYLKVYDNIRLSYLINHSLVEDSQTQERIHDLAKAVGIADKLNRKVRQLSRGEQQRVAICRALLPNPKLILADEPTGNLDPENKRKILDVLFEQLESGGQTLVVVTHDMAILEGFDRQVDFEDFRKLKESGE